MAKFVIDAQLPYYFSIWAGDDYVHVRDTDEKWTDQQIWEFAKENSLVIVTKDADFSERILLQNPPPRVIHIKHGKDDLRH